MIRLAFIADHYRSTTSNCYQPPVATKPDFIAGSRTFSCTSKNSRTANRCSHTARRVSDQTQTRPSLLHCCLLRCLLSQPNTGVTPSIACYSITKRQEVRCLPFCATLSSNLYPDERHSRRRTQCTLVTNGRYKRRSYKWQTKMNGACQMNSSLLVPCPYELCLCPLLFALYSVHSVPTMLVSFIASRPCASELMPFCPDPSCWINRAKLDQLQIASSVHTQPLVFLVESLL